MHQGLVRRNQVRPRQRPRAHDGPRDADGEQSRPTRRVPPAVYRMGHPKGQAIRHRAGAVEGLFRQDHWALHAGDLERRHARGLRHVQGTRRVPVWIHEGHRR